MTVAGYVTDAVTITANTNHPEVKRLSGFSIRENAATPLASTVRLRDGGPAGQILNEVELGADQSATLLSTTPIRTPGGVYVELVDPTGRAIQGVLYQPRFLEGAYP